jgi:hypothetical protein
MLSASAGVPSKIGGADADHALDVAIVLVENFFLSILIISDTTDGVKLALCRMPRILELRFDWIGLRGSSGCASSIEEQTLV